MRVLIVTRDLVGPVVNGGIGTACTSLAEFFSGEGHDVDILFTLGPWSHDGNFEYWQRYYKKIPANLIPIPLIGNLETSVPMARSYMVYRWLKARQKDYDLIYGHEWEGNLYYSLLAKQQGIMLAETPIAIGVHSPTSWVYEGNRNYLDDYDPLAVTYMEKRCIQMADFVIYPSKHMKEWVEREFEIVHPGARVIQNIMPKNAHKVVIPDGESPEQQTVDHVDNPMEVVFFGRFTRKKGVHVFTDAIGLINEKIQVTYLGSEDHFHGGEFSREIQRLARTWEDKSLNLLTNKTQKEAMKYLSTRKPLVVMGSVFENLPYTVMECIGLGLPILVPEKSGGTLELLHDPDPFTYKRDAKSLAQKIEEMLAAETLPVPILAEPQWRVKSEWNSFLDEASKLPAKTYKEVYPKVSVCMAHYNRPQMLEVGLKSLRNQTYKGEIEIVVCDDHSKMENFQPLEQFKEEGLIDVLLRNPENVYLGATRNNAIRASSGEYILIMDDDNVAKPSEIEVLVRAMTNMEADAISVAMDKFTGDLDPHYAQQIGVATFLGGCVYCGMTKNMYGDANSMYKAESIKSVMYTEDYGLGFEDWELLANMTIRGMKVSTCPEPLFYYRIHPNDADSMLMSGPDYLNMKRMLRVYEEHIGGELGKYIPEYVHGIQKRLFGAFEYIRWIKEQMRKQNG